MSDSKHTPGPWKWFGSADSNHIYLATTHSGRRYVMDFVRWGMRGAQPRFQPKSGMVDAKDLLQFEVGDKSIVGIEDAKKDESVYRYDVRAINCADARLIAAAPDLLDAIANLLQVYSEPDRILCCDGRDCGCMGATVHQQAEYYARKAIDKAEGRS